MLLEEISGCCASVIPRSPIGLWTTTNPDSVLPSSRMVQPLDHSCQNHFHAASYQLLSPSRFFIPSLLQLTVQHQKKKKLFKIISSFNYFNFVQKFIHNIFKPISLTFHRQFLHFISEKEKKNLSRIRNKKKKKKKKRKKKENGDAFCIRSTVSLAHNRCASRDLSSR